MTPRGVRRGFTLIEVIVAVAVTGLVAGLAFGTASAGIDTRERLARVRREEATAGALRELLHDALRHAEAGVTPEDTTFVLGGADGMRFVSRGIMPPLGTGGRWAISVTARGGVTTLLALPLDEADRVPVRVVAPAIARLELRTLAQDATAWRATWDQPATPPVAVAVRFLGVDGRDVVPALVARTRPSGVAQETP